MGRVGHVHLPRRSHYNQQQRTMGFAGSGRTGSLTGSGGCVSTKRPSFPVLADFQNECGVPFVDGYKVEEIGETGSTLELGEGLSKVAATLPLGSSGAVDPAGALTALASGEDLSADAGSRWLRAYWNPERREATDALRDRTTRRSLPPRSPNWPGRSPRPSSRSTPRSTSSADAPTAVLGDSRSEDHLERPRPSVEREQGCRSIVVLSLVRLAGDK